MKTLPRAELMYRGGAAQRWHRLVGNGRSSGLGGPDGGAGVINRGYLPGQLKVVASAPAFWRRSAFTWGRSCSTRSAAWQAWDE